MVCKQWLRQVMAAEGADLQQYIVVILGASHSTVAVLFLSYLAAQGDIGQPGTWYFVAAVAFGIILILFCKPATRTPTRFFLTTLSSFLMATAVAEFRLAGLEELWAFSICFSDILLLTRCKSSHINLSVAFTAVYLTVVWAESTFHLGLYPARYDLTDTPVRPLTVLTLRLFVIIFDFFMTRGFATSMVKQRARAVEGIRTAQAVTLALEAFDLDKASLALESLHDPELRVAFKGLIANLRMYRPYLPDVLFASTPEHSHERRADYPGKLGGMVALVFTDIQSSTNLWERCPVGMKKALALHDDVMRSCIASCNGYEVKTVGDSFMVAFDTAGDAAEFCLMAQERLYGAEWPEDVLRHPLCHPVDGIWNGLRIRMGLNYGAVEVQCNPITGRADYFGPPVNKAARLEGTAVGGTAAFPSELLGEMQERIRGTGKVHRLGERMLRGIGEVAVLLLVPASLAKRLHACNEKESPRAAFAPIHPSSSDAPLGRLRSRLQVTMATVGNVRVTYTMHHGCDPLTETNSVVGAVLESAERTEGTVMTLCSGSVVVGWNIGKSCAVHLARAARFAWEVNRRKAQLSHSISLGLAVGTMYHGNVGTAKQRFATLLGTAVEVAAALSATASILPVPALVSSTEGEDHPCGGFGDLEKHVHRIDELVIGGTAFGVFVLNVEAFAEKWGQYSDGLVWSEGEASAVANKDLPVLSNSTQPLLRALGSLWTKQDSLPVPTTLPLGGVIATAPESFACSNSLCEPTDLLQ